MHTSLRHYAITLERDAQRSQRVIYASDVAAPATQRRARRSLRLPSIARVARRAPAYGG